jgi:hypothetical protein
MAVTVEQMNIEVRLDSSLTEKDMKKLGTDLFKQQQKFNNKLGQDEKKHQEQLRRMDEKYNKQAALADKKAKDTALRRQKAANKKMLTNQKTWSQKMTSSLGGIQTMLIAAFGAVAIAQIKAFASASLSLAADISTLSESVGVSTDTFQTLLLVGTQVGINQEQLRGMLNKVKGALAEANSGTKTYQDALRDLGLTGSESIKEVMQRMLDLKDEASAEVTSAVNLVLGIKGAARLSDLETRLGNIDDKEIELKLKGDIIDKAALTEIDNFEARLAQMGLSFKLKFAAAITESGALESLEELLSLIDPKAVADFTTAVLDISKALGNFESRTNNALNSFIGFKVAVVGMTSALGAHNLIFKAAYYPLFLLGQTFAKLQPITVAITHGFLKVGQILEKLLKPVKAVIAWLGKFAWVGKLIKGAGIIGWIITAIEVMVRFGGTANTTAGFFKRMGYAIGRTFSFLIDWIVLAINKFNEIFGIEKRFDTFSKKLDDWADGWETVEEAATKYYNVFDGLDLPSSKAEEHKKSLKEETEIVLATSRGYRTLAKRRKEAIDAIGAGVTAGHADSRAPGASSMEVSGAIDAPRPPLESLGFWDTMVGKIHNAREAIKQYGEALIAGLELGMEWMSAKSEADIAEHEATIARIDAEMAKKKEAQDEELATLRALGFENTQYFKNKKLAMDEEQKRLQERRKDEAKEATKIWEKQRNARATMAKVNAFLAAARTYAQFGWPLGAVLAPIALMAGLAQANAIKKEQAPKFAQGGFVPGAGNADNVNATVTPGEFVVNRTAAQRNAESLEYMNRGGIGQAPGNNIVINVDGNVVAEDNWVQDRLLPAINEAVRNGHELQVA